MTRLHRSSLAAVAAALVLSLTAPMADAVTDPQPRPAASAPIVGAEESLGYPIESRVLSQDQSQGVDAEGRPQAYWVTAGNDVTPGMFQVTDLRSGEVVFGERLPAGAHSWASTFNTANGTVYFAMTSGEMYSWTPGDDAVTALGVPFPGEGIWRLDAAPDGVVYGGTYPGGLLFSYDPATGEFADHGQAVPGETYARALEADDESVWVGTQPRARLTRFDRGTGQFHQVALPAQYETHEVVYDMTLARDYLLLRVQPSNDLLVYDTSSGEFVNIVPGISGRAISPPDPAGKYVYFRISAQGVVAYDLDTHTYAPIGWGPNAFPGTWAWIDLDHPDFPGLSLAMTYYYGRIYVWNPTTKKTLYIGEGDLQGAPNSITALGSGPDGAVYVGAFLSPPGMARFDPADDSTTLLAGAGQVEGFGTYGEHLVFGRYPNAGLLDFDTTRPWSMGTNPGPPATIAGEQDRPQAFAQVGDLMAVGSVPKSGRLGGALSLWDPATGEVVTHRNVVPDQSVVSLAERDGLLYGGTSINGGYGIDPVATEAELFVADPDTGTVLHRLVPVPGGRAVNGLTFDADGTLWGVSDGTLFTYDPATRSVTRAEQLFPRTANMYGHDRHLVFRGDGYLYVTSSGSLWRVDPQSWAATRLASSGVASLALDEKGDLYYARGAALYRWNFSLRPQPVCDVTVSGPHAGPLRATAGTTCLDGASVDGPVQVSPGAVLVAEDSAVRGPVRAIGAGGVQLDSVTVTGPVSVTGAVGGVWIDGTTVDGPVELLSNSGGTTVSGLTVTGPLSCTGNEPPPVLENVDVDGPVTGQCREA
ncbi:hypothetical protein E1262_16080 [Jiangella aurantiaca]|uniref:SMP-30/Gluconolactonase/LRE-like region domain-containing protein n=1 Tax=Jiangella aurantiaca TaxID=2530373 RepID=A0A4R5AC02_9ACTN|nr:hypothetical protein [Jiangella aurantiaca]TDD68324.1 hypothetical protein E1262_16080 [Jiangella aurantiaca]